MRTSWRFMNWRGVPIVLNWSVLLALPLFYALYETLIGMAMAFVAFFFLLLIHELGHAAVAKWRGVPVLEIRLFLLHGHCRHELPDRKSDEIWIAWGGVAAQFALFLIALGVSELLKALAIMVYLHAMPALRILITVNLFIILFNLIPVPTLDGAKAWQVLPMAWKRWLRDRRLRRESKAVAADIIEQLKKRQ